MKKLLFLIILQSLSGFSQDKELCDLAFSNKDNFRMLSTFSEKIPKKFKIIDSTITWNSKIFYLENINLNDSLVMKEIEKDEHNSFHSSYLFSNKILDSKIDLIEKQRLSKIARKIKSKKTNIYGANYITIQKFKFKKGFYFFVSEPIYTKNNRFAFLKIDIQRKYKFLGERLDEYLGNLVIMFEKNQDKKWSTIYIHSRIFQ